MSTSKILKAKNKPVQYPPDFYEQIDTDFHDGDGRHSPQSLIGGFRGYQRSLLPPPYDRFPYKEDGSVLEPCKIEMRKFLEDLAKKEDKKRKKLTKKKGVWSKANDPYPWEKDK